MALLTSLLGALVSLPGNADRSVSHAYTDTADTTLGRFVQDDLARHPGLSGFHILASGLDAFAARALLAQSAERSIDAQYYLLHNDLVGRLFLDMLLNAADRGVRVRLLVDDMTLGDTRDTGMAALDSHDNVDIRVFNPFTRRSWRWLQILTRFDDVTRRMHNKSFTVDNQFTVVGGRNIGNEYFEADPELEFGDLDALAIGPVVREVSNSFDSYWNSESSYPISSLLDQPKSRENLQRFRASLSRFVAQQHDSDYLRALRDSALAVRIRADRSSLVERITSKRFNIAWGKARVLFDDPAKVSTGREQTAGHLFTQFQPLMMSIENELTVFSPYFVPGRQGMKRLRELRRRGVRVRILTNSLASTDVAAVHAGYARYRPGLLRAGVELYEIDDVLSRAQRRQKKGPSASSKASLHAKSFVIDAERVFIGSMNLDPRSVVENTEIGLLIESPAVAAAMSAWFDREASDIAYRVELERNEAGKEVLAWYRDLADKRERLTTEPNTGFWRRFGVGLLQLLPIESLL